MHILFADDTLDTLKLYRLVFELEGFTVETVSDGVAAVQAVREQTQPFDAILLDIEMPLLNGWDALKAIRALPQGQHPVIILITAYGGAAKRALVVEAGADDLFLKPMMPQDMVHALRKTVELHSRTAAQ